MSAVAKSLAVRASARSWINSFMTPSVTPRWRRAQQWHCARPLGAAGAIFQRDAYGARPSRILSATAKFFFLRAAARRSITRGMSLASKSSDLEPPACAGGLVKKPRMFDSSLIVVINSVERGDGRGIVLPRDFQILFIAIAIGDLGQLEQFADGAARVEVVVHRREESLAAFLGGR